MLLCTCIGSFQYLLIVYSRNMVTLVGNHHTIILDERLNCVVRYTRLYQGYIYDAMKFAAPHENWCVESLRDCFFRNAFRFVEMSFAFIACGGILCLPLLRIALPGLPRR